MTWAPTKVEAIFTRRDGAVDFAKSARNLGARRVKVAPTLPLYKGAPGGKYTSVHLTPQTFEQSIQLADAAYKAGALRRCDVIPSSSSGAVLFRREGAS